MQARPHAVILAGGQARRMGGGDKPLRRLGDRTLLDHVIGRIGPHCAAMALSANGDPARFDAWGLKVIADDAAGQGPLAGILAGLRWARAEGAAWLLSVPGDTPFLPADLVSRLAAAQCPIAYATAGGRGHYAVALISTELIDDLGAALAHGARAIRDWMQPHRPAAIAFPGDPFRNVNTPADLVDAAACLARTSQSSRPGS